MSDYLSRIAAGLDRAFALIEGRAPHPNTTTQPEPEDQDDPTVPPGYDSIPT
jgi:hypothetical protein